LLAGISFPKGDRVLVGLDRPDDGGVYLLREGLALVQSVDVISPIADDPFDFGRIAASNALSDVYAMGGSPLTALAVVAFPVKAESGLTFRRMLQGGLTVLAAADAALIGGHSIDDPELKLGFSVTGTVDPGAIMTKGGALPGDVLVLTKQLGTGLITTALKKGQASASDMAAAIRSMTGLNRAASEAGQAAGVGCCTDVTGFGLLGHLMEVVKESDVIAEVNFSDVPMLPGAEGYARRGLKPGGTRRNGEFCACGVEGLDRLEGWAADVLFDPQTSGGLLFSVSEQRLETLVERLKADGEHASVIGRIVDAREGGRILVRD